MTKRISIVNQTKVTDVSISSVFHIGDSTQISPRSWALAVQRERQIFLGNEGNFPSFPIFTMDVPFPAVDTNVTINRFHAKPFIKVNSIRIIGVTASSVYQIGSTNVIDADARVKHIRQLEPRSTNSGTNQ